jgi:hypothetical protein
MPADKSKRRSPRPPKPESTPTQAALLPRFASVIERHSLALAIALVAIASIRIAATYTVFSHTSDEPAHIACGMEWLDRGVYRYEAQHPPLARVAAAIGPYLLGRRSHGTTGDAAMYHEGLAILYQGDDYDATLAAARAGVLPFFWIACFVVYAWAKRDFGTPTAVVALLLFTFLPPVLAHAGLATTDMALTGFLGAAFLAGRSWLERPGMGAGAIFGFCGALAILSKFSSLAFFPAAAALALAWFFASGRLPLRQLPQTVRDRLPSFAVAIAVACLTIWAAYRFSFGKVDFAGIRLPAPELYRGIRDVALHNSQGHLSYLLGSLSRNGFWDFYFVVLAVKTPIALLVLLGAGVVFVARSWRKNFAACLPIAFAAAILLVGIFSRINIGVRHLLPVYIAFSILAAAGLLRLLAYHGAPKWLPAALALTLGWYLLGSLLSHPDYLPYFNEFAGSHPERILVDSDLDWGQDIKRLDRRLAREGARSLVLASPYWLDDRQLPPRRLFNRASPVEGWNAVSLTEWKLDRFGVQDRHPEAKYWPDVLPPNELVGRSIYLWYFPPASGPPGQ